MWSIDNDAHKEGRDETSPRQSNQPAEVAPSNHPPVDALVIPITQTNSHRCAHYALRRRNWDRKTGGEYNG